MKAFATYATRFHGQRIDGIKEHWNHHRPLCVNGVVCIDARDYTDDLKARIEALGLAVCVGADTTNFDHNLAILCEAANRLTGEWILTLDSDEFIPPHEFPRLALAVRECSAYGASWVRGWMCDRLAKGGNIPASAPDTYAEMLLAFPVMADITAKLQGSSNTKCIVSRKPHIGRIHFADGDAHPTWIRMDHFKWHGNLKDELRDRLGMVWGSQYKRTLDHLIQHGRIKAENYLTTSWEHIHGWFDFWNLYIEILKALPSDRRLQFVEVGVWQGKSAIFLSQYALAMGLDFHLWLVDVFRGCEMSGGNLKKISRDLCLGSSFVANTAANLAQNGAGTCSSMLQVPSDQAARFFDDGSCDLVFIDADHSYEAAFRDVSAWLPKMRKGGFLAGHDYDHPTVKKAVDEISVKLGLNMEQRGKCWLVKI